MLDAIVGDFGRPGCSLALPSFDTVVILGCTDNSEFSEAYLSIVVDFVGSLASRHLVVAPDIPRCDYQK